MRCLDLSFIDFAMNNFTKTLLFKKMPNSGKMIFIRMATEIVFTPISKASTKQSSKF